MTASQRALAVPLALLACTTKPADPPGRFGDLVIPGKHANFVLFDGNPLAVPRDLLGGKTVIKDGVIQ